MSQIKVEKLKGLNVPDNGPELVIDSSGNFNFDSGTLYIDSVNGRIGVNKTNPAYALDVTGTARITGSLTTSGGISASNGTGGAGQLLTADGAGGMSWQNAPISLPAQSSSTAGAVLMSDGSAAFWTYTLSPLGNLTNPNWSTARTFTHGFTAGGYQNSSPWRNVNRAQHSNDSNTNIGDIMSDTAAYCDAGHGDYYMYVYGMGGMGGSSTTWSMNMTTQSSRGNVNGMIRGRNDMGPFQDYHHAGAKVYVTGGGDGNTDRQSMVTETWSDVGRTVGDGGDYSASAEHQNYGFYKRGGTGNLFAWATETYSSWGGQPGTDGWGKGLSAVAQNYVYFKNGGNLNSTLIKHSGSNGSQLSSFGVDNAGEENYQMGGNKGYCFGHYNGGQNNNSYKVNYNSDTATSSGVGQPQGHGGMSSAGCATASSLTNNTYGTTAPSY